MAQMKLSNELMFFFQWDADVRKEFLSRIKGVNLDSEQEAELYRRIVIELFPAPFKKMLDENAEWHNEQYTAKKCASLARDNTVIFPKEEKAALLKTLYKKNPNLKSLTEKLKLE